MADEQKPNRVQQLEENAAAMRAELDALRTLIKSQSSDQTGAEAVRVLAERSAPTNNPNYNPISPFTYPEGERVRPAPKLARATFFCGARQRNEELTPAEIDLFNGLTSTRVLTGRQYGDWKAEVRRNGTQEELHVDVPVGSVDARMSLPSGGGGTTGLMVILSELLTGDVQQSPAEVQAALVAKVAELERRLAVA